MGTSFFSSPLKGGGLRSFFFIGAPSFSFVTPIDGGFGLPSLLPSLRKKGETFSGVPLFFPPFCG